MSQPYLLPYDQGDGQDWHRRFWETPGLFTPDGFMAERTAPPPLPPDGLAAASCCARCPWNACEDCPPRTRWLAHYAKQDKRKTNTSPTTWWARLTAQMRRGATHQ